MVLGKRWSGILLALLAAVALAMLLAAPAWSQDERTNRDGKRDKKEASATERAGNKERTSRSDRAGEATSQRSRLTTQEASTEKKSRVRAAQEAIQAAQADGSNDLVGNPVRAEDNDNSGFIDLVRILDAANCTVEQDAVIVFEDRDSSGVFYWVIDNFNVQINNPDDEVRVRDIQNRHETVPANPDEDIEFIDENGNFVLLPDGIRLRVEGSAGIDCGSNNGGGGGRGQYRGDRFFDRFLEDFLFDEQYDEGEVLEEAIAEELDDEEDTLDEEETTDETIDDTTAETLDEGTEPFTDPDTRTPTENPVGPVSDEIPDRSTPLPETGGPAFLLLFLGVPLLLGGAALLWRLRRR